MIGLESFAAGYLLYASAQARPSWCKNQTAPQVKVVPQMAPLTYDFSRSQKNLNNLHVDTINPYGKSVHTDTGGLMHGTVQLKAGTSYRTVQFQGYACSFYETITITVQLTPKILIASEYPKGGCKHNAILQHELKHVQVERLIANHYSQVIGQQMVNAIKKYSMFGPYRVSDQPQTQAQMSRIIEDIVTRVNDAMSADRIKRQQEVDNINEYNRVNKLIQSCRN